MSLLLRKNRRAERYYRRGKQNRKRRHCFVLWSWSSYDLLPWCPLLT